MKILILVDSHGKRSESYIRCESEWLARHADVRIWSDVPKIGGWATNIPVKSQGDPFRAFAPWVPDVVYVHWLTIACKLGPVLRSARVPVVVRGHSFDNNPTLFKKAQAFGIVRYVIAFPTQGERGYGGVRCVPVAYDAGIHADDPSVPKEDIVYRVAAGLHGKAIGEFLMISALPGPGRFVLAATTAGDLVSEAYIGRLEQFAQDVGSRAEILRDISHEEAAVLAQRSKVCLRGHDPESHPYGMPISIAEGMACGAIPVLRDCPGARLYAGPAASYYQTAEEARREITRILELPPADFATLRSAAVEYAKLYTTDAVMPKILDLLKKAAGR